MQQAHWWKRWILAAFWLVTFAGSTLFAAVPDGADDVSSLVSARFSSGYPLPNHRIRFEKLRLINHSRWSIAGPLGVVVTELAPAGTLLLNGTDSLPNGAEYLELVPAGRSLKPGGITPPATLLFEHPKPGPVRFRVQPYGSLPAGPAPANGQINVTGMTKQALITPSYDRKTGHYVIRLRMTNLTRETLYGPASVTFYDQLPDGAKLMNPTGVLPDGRPFVTIPLNGNRWLPNEVTEAVVLRFGNRSRARLQLQPTVYAKPTEPGSADPVFDAPNVWDSRVDKVKRHPNSDLMIKALAAGGDWGEDGTMRIDFSMPVLETSPTTTLVRFNPNANFYSPDCDRIDFPVPAEGAVEGEQGYACTRGGDCHLLVVDRPAGKLYEMYAASIVGSQFSGGCAVVWDVHRSYPPELRGDQCTSTDSAGLPIAPLVFSADEIATGSINHAIRFRLPKSRIRSRVFVRPASHAGAPTGTANDLPYGSRLRLRANYPLNQLPSDGARVIARAMQRYGIILADSGNATLTARDDRFTRHKWSEVAVQTHSLQSLKTSDFEVVDTGSIIDLTYDCMRNGL